jgi:hypothetical protein
MTLAIFEFGAVDPITGAPVYPPHKVTRGQALDAAFTLLSNTALARVVSTSAVRIACSSTPTAGDEYLAADTAKDFRLPTRGPAQTIYATAAVAANAATDVTIALAAGAANGMLITVTAVDGNGATVAAVHELELWMSEDATGIGFTADTYSGTLVASTGSPLTTLTAKKHFTLVTAATGIFAGTLTDTAKPADQYVAVRKPVGATLKVSTASGTSWG